jgi:prolyl-tRNA synthetase
VELGPRDLKEGQAVLARRDTLEKSPVKLEVIDTEVPKMLELIQQNLFHRATEFLRENTHRTDSYAELKSIIATRGGVVQAPWCGSEDCETKVKEETGAKIVNLPLDQQEGAPIGNCIYCGRPGKVIANFAKSY